MRIILYIDDHCFSLNYNQLKEFTAATINNYRQLALFVYF